MPFLWSPLVHIRALEPLAAVSVGMTAGSIVLRFVGILFFLSAAPGSGGREARLRRCIHAEWLAQVLLTPFLTAAFMLRIENCPAARTPGECGVVFLLTFNAIRGVRARGAGSNLQRSRAELRSSTQYPIGVSGKIHSRHPPPPAPHAVRAPARRPGGGARGGEGGRGAGLRAVVGGC